ncbi:MAG: thymidine phosphorylase [Rhodothermales bacterium]
MSSVVDIIIAKRDGHNLPPSIIRSFIADYTAGNVPDYQMSAFLMACFLNGMNDDEAFALADAMLHSGAVLDLSDISGIKVDKHSTGGVGDKISLILAPVVAAAGVPVPMISGRGLGHTGGTLDKLEAIPGFRTDLNLDDYRRQLADIGLVLIGQTKEIAPADKKIYALRDVTGTVEFIPFIAASIMSKKLAEGIDALVLDVKWGSGAFMKTVEKARELAERLVGIGEQFGKKTVALLTNMNEPLGRAIGTWPETAESIACLKGADVPDVMELVLALSGEMICLGGKASTPTEGRQVAAEMIASGKALAKFREVVDAQGGDVSAIDDHEARSRKMKSLDVVAPAGMRGIVQSIDSYALGKVAVGVGAGRAAVDDVIDPLAGITLLVKSGESVEPGRLVARLHGEVIATDPERAKNMADALLAAYTCGEAPVRQHPLIADRLADGRWQNHGA